MCIRDSLIRSVIGHVANASAEFRHSLMIEREIKRVGYIVVTTDKGLCGGLNINLLGDADKVYASVKNHEIYALKPTDFHGLTPKLTVKVGDSVLAGSIIFFDKYNEKIKFWR